MAGEAPKKDSAFSQLAKQTPAAKAGILFVVLALLGGGYWQFVYKDLQTKKKSLESGNKGLVATGATLQARWNEVRPLSPGETLPIDPATKKPKERLLDKYQQLIREAPELGKALPAEAERNALQQTLQAKAESSRVDFKSWTNLPEQTTIEKFVKVPMNAEVEGTFHELLDYFRALGPPPLPAKKPSERKKELEAKGAKVEPPRQWDRLITIENLTLSITAVRSDEILLTAKFTASGFRQADKAPAGAPGAAPAAGGGAQPAAPAGGQQMGVPPLPPPKPSLMRNPLEEEKAKNPGLFDPS
jgi:hypothetical protein